MFKDTWHRVYDRIEAAWAEAEEPSNLVCHLCGKSGAETTYELDGPVSGSYDLHLGCSKKMTKREFLVAVGAIHDVTVEDIDRQIAALHARRAALLAWITP